MKPIQLHSASVGSVNAAHFIEAVTVYIRRPNLINKRACGSRLCEQGEFRIDSWAVHDFSISADGGGVLRAPAEIIRREVISRRTLHSNVCEVIAIEQFDGTIPLRYCFFRRRRGKLNLTIYLF